MYLCVSEGKIIVFENENESFIYVLNAWYLEVNIMFVNSNLGQESQKVQGFGTSIFARKMRRFYIRPTLLSVKIKRSEN